MKKFMLGLCALVVLIVSFGCDEPGVSKRIIGPQNENLPPELKGLVISKVSVGNGTYIYVGTLNDEAIATRVTAGKTVTNFTLLTKAQDKNSKVRYLEGYKIIFEDSTTVVLKKELEN